MNKLIFALSVLATATVFATDSIDFSADGSELRPLLHSTCFNANVKDHNDGQEPYLTNGGFASSETILWSEGDFNQRVTDLHHIFPLVGQDPDDAANYFFAASDRKLFYAARCNLDVMYRLGSAKESAGYNAHTLVPTNFANTAKVMSHIISHYTASKWADGIDYSSRISRWEIWSGPDDPDCWWAPNKTASELRTLFAEFFVTCLKQIKTDHPTVKVGGPALSKWDPDYMGAILDACDAEGVSPDFISYQCYTHDADALLAEPATIRAWLDARGANYANCEIILSAWHYLPDAEGVGTLTQLDMDKVHEASLGEGGTMTATAAAFNLAVLSGLQNTPLARAYHGASTAFSAFSPFHWSTYNTKTPHVAANAFKLFGTVTKDYTKVLSVQNDGARSVLAVANDAGTKGALLVTDSSTAAGNVEVPLTGLSGVSGLATKVVNASNSDVQTLSSGATLTATGATIAKQAGPQAYLLTFDTIVGDEPEPTFAATWYKVGQDGSSSSSWTQSGDVSAKNGWSSASGGTVASHTVVSTASYVVPSGALLRSPADGTTAAGKAFGGGELVLQSGSLALQSQNANPDVGANYVKVDRLVAEGGTIIHYTTDNRKTLDGAIIVREGGLKIQLNNNSANQRRSLTVASAVSGTGAITLMGGSVDSAEQYLRFTGDMSDFAGTILADGSTAGFLKNMDFQITGSFGGTITALPAGFTSVEVNYDGLDAEKGLRVASTTIPTALKTKLTLFGATDFTTENLPLMTFPAGTTVDPAAFIVKYAATVDGAATAFENLGTVENGDGSITLVANHTTGGGDEPGEDDPVAGGPTNLSPATTAENPVELLTEDQRAYLYTLTRDERYNMMVYDKQNAPSAWMAKPDLGFFQFATPLTLSWSGTTGTCTVSLKRLSDNKVLWTKTTDGCQYEVYNLEIGAGYEWTVTSDQGSATAVFYTSPTPPRVMKSGSMRNIRDVGGWTGLQGCKIVQNKLFRGGAVNPSGSRLIDADGLDFWTNEIGLKSEIDLRTDGEAGGGNAPFDQSGQSIAYYHYSIYENTLYTKDDTAAMAVAFREVFKKALDTTNLPLYFHCTHGRDRTGTVAALLEAVLGVSEEDVFRDYQASIYETTDGRNSVGPYGFMVQRAGGFKTFIAELKKQYPGETLAESAYKYLVYLGNEPATIEAFRTAMLEGYVAPEVPYDPYPDEPEEPGEEQDPLVIGDDFIGSLQDYAERYPADAKNGADIAYKSGNDTVYVFTQSGTFSLPAAATVDILVVGGGGAGGANCGGGGGGGGVTEVKGQLLAAGDFAVTVGAGGVAPAYSDNEKTKQGQAGGSSAFGELATANGGTGGCAYKYTQPCVGGTAGTGGGDGGDGTTTDNAAGGVGGNGTSSGILGPAQYFGGGGGAGGNASGAGGEAGLGGGGTGATASPAKTSQSGKAGLGGGGGGGAGGTGANNTTKGAASGGAGIVIVRVKDAGDEPEPTGNTYYFVGFDASGTSSFDGSTAGAAKGWATTQGGTPVQLNSLSSEDAFVLTGTDAMNTLRAPGSGNPTFSGKTLKLDGGWLALPGNSQTVTVNDLVANGGGIVHFSSDATMTLAGNLTVQEGGFKIYVNAGGNSRNTVIASTVTGTGPISFLGSTLSDSQAEYIDFSGDLSGWTGTIADDSSLSAHMKQLTLKFTGSFGGTITALPAGTVAVVVNYAGLPSGKGLRVATTSIPTALKTGLSFTGITDASAENLPLLTFPAGTVVDATQFTVKSGSTALTDLGTVENDDGSITLVANKPLPPPSVIEIPTGANLTYNGQLQSGVAAGVGYTLSGTFAATAVGNYTATATLDDPENTKWTDETTESKTINWSITKATNGWKTEPSLSKTSWPVNLPPATLNVGEANFGTMTATLNDAPFDLVNPVFPTEEGEYTLVITVAGSNDYDELVKEITFTITEAVDSATYYLRGQDGSGKTSFFASSNPGTVGWAETEDGAAITHTVAVGNNYVIPAGSVMRTAPNDDTDTFLGDTLKLAGEIWFKKAGNTASPVKVLSIPKLIADGGTLNNEKNDINAFEIQGGLEIPEGKTLTVLNQGDTGTTKTRNFKISSTTTGSGTLYVSLGGSSTSGTSSTLELAGDWSGFIGQVAAASGKTKLASWTFIISGAFGGAIGEMPDRSSNPNYIINLADNPDGIRIAGTGDALPTCLRYRTCFYGADFANGTDINLLRVPKSVRAALARKLEFKWAGSYADAIKGMQTGSSSTTAINESKISFVDNRDGTETYVYNRTTFYEKLANDTRKIDASSYATGGDYIYQVSEKEYIHVFKDSGTFTPNKDLTDVQVLVVGGGGSGGFSAGGGGGAGGLVYQTDVSFTSGTDYTVTVGAGGAKKTSSGSGNKGGSSSIGDITAEGGGGGGGMDSAGAAGGSGGGGSGNSKSGGAGTTDLGSAGGAGGVASGYAIGGGGGGAGQLGCAAGTLGPTQTDTSAFNAGCGGDGLEIGSAILGWSQIFAGGGGGGTAGGVKRIGTGGLGGGGTGGYDGNDTHPTAGEDGLGGGGGGGAPNWGRKDPNGFAGGKGVVIVRYMVPVDAKITGTITMSGWKEDETPSEPDLTGLTVTPDMAASALLVKYYADADCTQALDGKPILAGTYYVRAEIEKTRQYTAAVSEKTAFTIESGEKAVVPIPEVQSFVYDGTPKTCVEAGDGYTIDGDSTVTATGAGNYSVTLKLNDPETSQWSDLTSADKVIPWSIAQAENEWTTAAAIDKTEWMQRDAAGAVTSPVAMFGTAAATLNGEPWNGVMPTGIGLYTMKWTVAETTNYKGLEVEFAFAVLHDFDENAWSVKPSITKTSWKSTDAEPGVITPPTASFGGGTMVAEISSDGVSFAAWDGTMPTAKGVYTVRWTIAATEDYSGLESSVDFLIDCRYRPTHPFMCLKSGEDEWKGGWKGANTIADAVNLAGQNGTVEVCKDVDVSALLNLTMNVSLCSNKDDKGSRYTITVTADSSFGIYNNGKLTLSNIAFNLLPSANISKFASLGIFANNMGGTLEVKDNVEISGKVTGPLIQNVNGNNGTLYAHLVISGGTIKDLTAGSSLISAPGDTSFSVKNLTIENCTVSNGALIAAGSKTLNLSDVTITNNVTTAGAITVGEAGVIKVSGEVIVTGNTAGGVAKNVVPTNETNLELAGLLGAKAKIGVSWGSKGAVFGRNAITDEVTPAELKASAAKFFHDARPRALKGRINQDDQLYWVSASGTVFFINCADVGK